ncbi:RagB/SusD family nutrient uptake outer membrane protein [Pseudoflavitalea rhizosphaerae]|uniref:RagB/SusD family nutrient uptake outer membrane protein n=1 Tax=Pseudoflavitalea rhizosphaerae TaxID=1884793 RepID=UPI000F8EA51A|nr:RagB/SusD family nutrient uptake outer membrane protein [Pseudoflavitalea rhizosphaerae]
MKKKLFYITAILGATLFGSCSKFLEEKSQSEVIPKTTVDFRELLMGSGYYPAQEPADFLYFMDDDVEFNSTYDNGSAVGSSTARMYYPTFSWQPSFVDFNGLGDPVAQDPGTTGYATYYNWIKGCNAVLDYIDEAIGTQAERDRVKAEALAVRALYYWRLVNLYGDPYNANPNGLAVPLKLNSTIDEQYSKRATVKEVYDVIVRDLKEAARLMDPLPVVRTDYHINQPAIHILLSRVYLFMENWEGSVAEADKAFEQGSRLWDMTQLTAAYLHNYTNPEVEWLYGGSTQPDQSTYIPSNHLLGMFDENDARRKYGFGLSNQNANYVLVTKLATGVDLRQSIRTSEATLNKAEANVQLNKLTEAMNDLNALRRYRIPNYADENITDKSLLLQAIRDERRKEFCYELFRWFDLRRYGMPSISHVYRHEPGQPDQTYILKEKDPMYVLPFPNSLLIRNPALEQNPSAQMGERPGN